MEVRRECWLCLLVVGAEGVFGWWMKWHQPKLRLWVASANEDHFPFRVVYSDM